ncbi:MAG: AraC family transcriptional regulator [Planctomycetota bacterium]
MNENSDPAPLDYVERVNRAIDYILRNLSQALRLEDVAAVALFSPFHFHRVFKSLVGETLNQFVGRVRLERALFMMSHQRSLSLTEVAHSCGFASSSDFSRSFKKRFGVPPSAFDLESYRDQRRQELQDSSGDPKIAERLKRLPAGENPDGFAATIRELPPRCVAYLRVFDPYRPDVVSDAAQKLMAWAEERNLDGGQWLGYMWEDPEVVPLADCRYDVGVEVPDVQLSGEIGRMDFPAMTVAELEIRGGIDLELRAIDWLFRTWLPNSRYLPADQPCFEAWIGKPFAQGYEHFELKVHLPVVRS